MPSESTSTEATTGFSFILNDEGEAQYISLFYQGMLVDYYTSMEAAGQAVEDIRCHLEGRSGYEAA